MSRGVHKILVLMSARAGLGKSAGAITRAVRRYWDQPGNELTFHSSMSPDDSRRQIERARHNGTETLLIAGGDGLVNSVGPELLGSALALGVLPTGSGNGFARHFNIPLNLDRAARALASARRQNIDVGTANGRPFFVTCGLAWDAALVCSFEKSPIRGLVPYFLAGAIEYFAYERQPFEVLFDGSETLRFPDPMLFTIANLTEYGGGAKIAPQAQADDGLLELVVIAGQDFNRLLASFNRLYDGTLDQHPGVLSRRFRQLDVHRARPAPIQVDGELVATREADVAIRVLPKALTVLVPEAAKKR
ncbi:MAG: diacylglycerol kinase family protein [Kiritimatiellaeota bacterium]|nr:diacylglycerol kinase family protein [Kiritimatiellota bacterium]